MSTSENIRYSRDMRIYKLVLKKLIIFPIVESI